MALVTLDFQPSGAVTVVSDGLTKYCSPTGSASNPGTLDQPWPLSKLATPGSVQPGATVYLLGGSYVGAFTFAQVGTAGARITYRPYPGHLVTLDRARKVRDDGLDGLRVEGSHQVVRDLEVTNTNPERTLTAVENLKGRPGGVRMAAGTGNKIVNCYIHDTGGNSLDAGAVDCEAYGCTILREGWDGPPGGRGHGHGLYPQNFAGAGRKLFRNCIVGNGYAHSFHNFGGSSKMSEVALEHSTLFMGSACTQNGDVSEPIIFAGETGGATGTAVIDGVAVRECIVYQRYDHSDGGISVGAIRIGTVQPTGHQQQVHANIELIGNLFVGVVSFLEQVTALRFKRNACFGQARPGPPVGTPYPVDEMWRGYGLPQGGPQQRFNAYPEFCDRHDEGQTWIKRGGSPTNKTEVLAGVGTFTAGSNGYHNDTDFPPTDVVKVAANEYEAGRAHVTILNHQSAATVAVDLDGVCEPGQDYELTDIESGAVTPFSYNGSGLTVTMARPQALDPIGGAIRDTRRTGVRFGVFLVRRA